MKEMSMSEETRTRVNENGRATLLEFITSAETAFSHRGGAAA